MQYPRVTYTRAGRSVRSQGISLRRARDLASPHNTMRSPRGFVPLAEPGTRKRAIMPTD